MLLADDHATIRGAIRSDLEELGYEVCGEAGDAPAAVAAAVAHRPELCLLDVEMPGSGITAAQEIAVLVPETHVVMLTVSRDGRDVEASLAAGARGFVLKDVPSERLDAALRAVLDGELVTPGSSL
ncbi:MAG TPA: response regulator transcription factor [Gaiellaceae bacterium]|nr:response regulator transcription factor [Gaiellaceae bacterium]